METIKDIENKKAIHFAQKMQQKYAKKETTKVDKLKELDSNVKNPARIFAYVFGVIGALILGTGMCFAMQVLGNSIGLMIMGIVIGLIGIAIVSSNYFIYKHIIETRKRKYSAKILKLSSELLNEQNSILSD